MSRKKWIVSPLNKEKASYISETFGIDPFASLLLASRGITDDESINEFINDEAAFCDPFDLIDMDKAVERINRAIEYGEKIAVYGDYDADGVTAASLLYLFLEMLGADVICYIPDRNSEGYGLNKKAIKMLEDDGINLIVTVDNGISAIPEAEYIYELGMNLVITDHHKVGPTIPKAEAIVDPHRKDCPTKFKDWAGVGVAFKLACALSDGEFEEILDSYADLITIGTIADVVPLTNENRSIVKLGVKKINSGNNCGLNSLRKIAGVSEKALSSNSIAFSLVPRINAIGRVERADKAFELLVSESSEIADDIAQSIDEANIMRQTLEQQITIEAENQLKNNPQMLYDRVLVFDGKDWHGGVIGIVAARFVERYGKPCIVITSDGNESKGSGRSLDGFSLYDAIYSVNDLLTHFGGHTLAAGFGIKTEDIPEFRKRVNDYAKTCVMPFPLVTMDCRLRPEFISAELLPVISMLEPFGAGNPQPVFGLYDMTLVNVQSIGNGKHIKLSLTRGNANIQALKFSMTAEEFPYKKGDKLDLAVRLERNEYMGSVRVSIYIKDMKMAGTDDEKYLNSERLYEKVRRGDKVSKEDISNCLPDRKFIAEVYRYIRDNIYYEGNTDVLCYRLGDDGSHACKVLFSIEILKELGVFVLNSDGKITVNQEQKVDLESSELMIYLKSLC